MNNHNDVENYKKLSKPFADRKAAAKALDEFFERTQAIRQELGLMDVHIVVKLRYADKKKVHAAMSNAHFGNSLEGVGMCAWSMNTAVPALDEVIARQRFLDGAE